MTSDVNTSRRPSLEPLWTNYRNSGGTPKTVFRPTPINAGLSPSPVSPKSLPGPSPIHPASYDGSMRRQDRALVNSLDQRARHVINSAPLTPIDECSPSPLVARLERISILPPMSIAQGLPTPASPDTSPQGDHQHASDGYRSIAMRDSLLVPQDRSPGFYTTDDSLSPISPRKDSTQDQLRTWGHIYFGNAKTADAFIIARSLRRHGNNSPTETKGLETKQVMAFDKPGVAQNKRLTIRAIVRPRALDKPSFLIQRTFNMDELRATIPDPPLQQQPSASSEGPGPLPVSPHSRILVPSQPRARRSSSVRSGTLLRSGPSSLDLESLIRDAKAIPIHLRYARAYLPVVAALLLSGHTHEGDVIYLPMPHAEAWPHTARYVYTGQGELTEAVKENILYLAGKV